MKKWNNPELMILGVEKTQEDDCTCEPTLFKVEGKNQHYCHSDGKWHDQGCGHSHGGGACKDPAHGWSESHKASCCCLGLS